MRQSIRNKIIINFFAVITVIICAIVSVVSWQLYKSTAEQSDLLAQELTTHTFAIVNGYHAITIAILNNILQEVIEYGNSIANGSPIADNIDRQQKESIVEFLQTSAAKEGVDFALIFNARGELQASSEGGRSYKPGDSSLPPRSGLYKGIPIAQKVNKILQQEIRLQISPQESAAREKAANLNGFIRLEPQFLRNLGVVRKKINTKGEIALISAGIIRDDFSVPTGMFIVGKIINNFNQLFQALHKATDIEATLYLGNTPVAFSGFNHGIPAKATNGPPVVSQGLAAKIYAQDQPVNVVLSQADGRYLSTCAALRDIDHKKIGILCTGLPDSQIAKIQKPLLKHGIKTEIIISKWLVIIGTVMILIFIIIAWLIAAGITRPLEEMVEFTTKVGEGDFSHRLENHANNEIGYLGRSIDMMLDSLDIARREKEKLEDQLRQVQKMEAIGTLAGGMAHEFSNILQVMLGYAGLARDDAQADSKTRDDIEEIIKAGNRARELVQQITAFSRNKEENLEPVKICDAVKEAVKLLRNTTPAAIEVRQHICTDTDCHKVMANYAMIHQILANLYTNAVQAMDEKGVIEISMQGVTYPVEDAAVLPALPPGEYIKLTVADNGPGIEPALKERIFEPFFTTKDVGRGTGMGLSIVYGIVKKLEGFVWVEREPGKGASFHVYLPVTSGYEQTLPQ
ncbi:MAG: HAMP domain-containing protein [Deltaproteobacteria bacterium]|nr:HAMP domain-containing protein [Deltaproteobacteria bacterium]